MPSLRYYHYTNPANKYMMHTYDAITNSGLHIHLSMSNNNTCYIFSRDIYNHVLTMKFFTNVEDALMFIQSL